MPPASNVPADQRSVLMGRRPTTTPSKVRRSRGRGPGALRVMAGGEDPASYTGTAARSAASARNIPSAVVWTQVKIGTSVRV